MSFPQFASFPAEIQSMILESCPPNDQTCLRLTWYCPLHLLDFPSDSHKVKHSTTPFPPLQPASPKPLSLKPISSIPYAGTPQLSQTGAPPTYTKKSATRSLTPTSNHITTPSEKPPEK